MAMLLGVGIAAAQTQSGAPNKFVPSDDSMRTMLTKLDLPAETFSVDRGEWDESLGFTVADDKGLVAHTLVVYAVVLPTAPDAHDFYISRTRQLELDNETTHSWNTPKPDVSGADESRDFRLVYVDIASRSRSGEYARLLRRGNYVGLVEVVGSPAPDDDGVVDPERLSILVGASQLLLSRLGDQPPPPPNTAELPRLPRLVTIPFGIDFSLNR
jgi:hypothetical protein